MREFWNSIQLIFAAVGGWLGWFLGKLKDVLEQLHDRAEKGGDD